MAVMQEIVPGVILSLFMIGPFYSTVGAQSSQEDNFVIPVVLVYPSIWVEKNTIPPAIEVHVLNQSQEDNVLDAAEGDEKKALDTEYSIRYFEIPNNSTEVDHEIEVCISAVDTKSYPKLSKCTRVSLGEEFPDIPVFVIE
jgi:hypothetical protein